MVCMVHCPVRAFPPVSRGFSYQTTLLAGPGPVVTRLTLPRPDPTSSSVLNPNFGRVNATLWQANSFYDAMQVDVAKRMSHGIQFHGAYTFGKSIDTLSATEANDAPMATYRLFSFAV